MKELYYLLGILPAYFYGPEYHPLAFKIISVLLTLPLLKVIYDSLFSEMIVHQDVDKEYLKHKRRTGDAPPPFPNGWFRLAYSFEVDVKKAIYVEALGEHFVIFRGENGKVTVMDAYCPHLGANLAYGGVVKDNCISCPFHAWKFDQNGKCVDIPYNKEGAKIPENAKTKVWKSVEQNQLIMVWYHAENEEPTWFPHHIKEVDEGKFIRHGRSAQYIRAHPQDLHENGPDSAHLNVVHSDGSIFGSILKHHWSAEWHEMEKDKKHVSRIQVNQQASILGLLSIPFSNVVAHINQHGPGIVHYNFHTPIGKIELYETVTPIRPYYTRMDHIIFADWKIPRFISKIFLFNITFQVSKDMDIWSNKIFREKPMLCQGDGRIASFRKWYSQFYSPNSISYEDVKKKESAFEW
eukprot:gene9433-1639_t